MTPAELNLFIEGRGDWIKDLEDMFIYNAWLSVALDRQKRLPRLQKILNKRTQRKQKTPEEAKQELQELISRLHEAGEERGNAD
jgi:uncharacterized protein YifN (PemK superfamily)